MAGNNNSLLKGLFNDNNIRATITLSKVMSEIHAIIQIFCGELVISSYNLINYLIAACIFNAPPSIKKLFDGFLNFQFINIRPFFANNRYGVL